MSSAVSYNYHTNELQQQLNQRTRNALPEETHTLHSLLMNGYRTKEVSVRIRSLTSVWCRGYKARSCLYLLTTSRTYHLNQPD